MMPTVQRADIDGRAAWLLSMRSTVVLLSLGSDETLLLPYWGAQGQTARPTDYLPQQSDNRPSQRAFLDGKPVAYPVYGDPLYKEVCLVAARADGSRETHLSFVDDR